MSNHSATVTNIVLPGTYPPLKNNVFLIVLLSIPLLVFFSLNFLFFFLCLPLFVFSLSTSIVFLSLLLPSVISFIGSTPSGMGNLYFLKSWFFFSLMDLFKAVPNRFLRRLCRYRCPGIPLHRREGSFLPAVQPEPCHFPRRLHISRFPCALPLCKGSIFQGRTLYQYRAYYHL